MWIDNTKSYIYTELKNRNDKSIYIYQAYLDKRYGTLPFRVESFSKHFVGFQSNNNNGLLQGRRIFWILRLKIKKRVLSAAETWKMLSRNAIFTGLEVSEQPHVNMYGLYSLYSCNCCYDHFPWAAGFRFNLLYFNSFKLVALHLSNSWKWPTITYW